MNQKLYSLFFVIFMAVLNSIGYFGVDLYLPALPVIAKSFDCGGICTKLILSCYFWGFALGALILGFYSDMVGRKKVILMGICLSAVASIICFFDVGITTIILGRILQGIGLGAVTAAARAVLTDKFSGKKLGKFLSVLNIMIPAILSVAPNICSTILVYYSWRHIFLFLFIYLMIIFSSGYFFKNTNRKIASKKFFVKQLKFYKDLKNKEFILYTLYYVFLWIGTAAFMTVSPFLFQNVMGLSIRDHGLSFLLTNGMMISGSILNFRLLKNFSCEQMIATSSFTTLLSSIMLISSASLNYLQIYFFFIGIAIFFLGFPIGISNAFVLAFYKVNKRSYGNANAFLLFVQVFMIGIASFLFVFMPMKIISLGIFFMIIALSCMVLIFYARYQSWIRKTIEFNTEVNYDEVQ